MSNLTLFSIFFLLFLITTFASSLNNIHKCPKKQSEALLLFKHNLSSINYTTFDFNNFSCHQRYGSDYYPIITNWNTSTDCCNWNGVTCDDSTGDVIGIDLSCGMLKGTIHPNTSLFNLPHLQTLNLAFNDFYGSQIPREIGRFSNSLTHLNLSNCWFSGQVPPDITLLQKLVSLDLSLTRFINDSNIYTISELKLRPDVFINMFHNFTNLEELSLGGVIISSVLPTSLNIPSSLKLLTLDGTRLKGKIPHYIFNLHPLETLDLSWNTLTGDIPMEVNLTHLSYLELSRNKLNGTLPSWLFTSPSLQYLYLDNNRFSRNVPFRQLTNSPSICNMSNLKYLDMSNNRFGGSIPQCFGNIISSLILIDMGNNSFQGTIPNVDGDCGSLEGLILKGNQLEGELPSSLSKCQSLKVVDLGNNHLNGTFPSWLGDLPNLQVLLLKSNKFHGHIQPSFAVKFSFPNLHVLDLSHNRFVGQLPAKYIQNFNSMKNAVRSSKEPEYLFMGGKYYSFVVAVKGVDREFPRLFVSLTIIDLSNNYFEGGIPEIIGNLSSLKVLSLSHNSLNGRIPDSLGKLSEIESLDLSCNQLTGNIPERLADLTFLGFLNLSKNHLEGSIPQGNQLRTFEENSYRGNPKLCGFPLPRKCNEYLPEVQLEADEDEEESGFTWKMVMLGYGCGTIIGLVIGYLMLSSTRPNWLSAIADAGEHMILKRRDKRRRNYMRK